MKYAFIEDKDRGIVSGVCVNCSTFLLLATMKRWRPQSVRALANQTVREQIAQTHVESRGTYGRPRIHAELRAQGVTIGINRIGRLMKAAGIKGIAPRRFRKTTDSTHTLPIAENILDRQFDIKQIASCNRVCAGDITYLPTREGLLYLAVDIDLVSRRVIGWSMSTSMERSLVINAFRSAIRSRRSTSGTIFHSGRGSQYANEDFRNLLKVSGMRASMSRKAECWDNACVEGFFGSMKRELGDPIWDSRVIAQATIFDNIEIWYNQKRRHSTFGYVSPEEYESSPPPAA